jgi:hypothetical protein
MTDPSVPDPKLKTQIFTSLASPKFTWRTANGISKDTGLDPEKVAIVLENSAEVIRSSSANTAGQALYSLRDRYRQDTPFIDRLFSVVKNST